LDKLPPDPIVREDGEGGLVAIDGHNLVAVKLHLGGDVEVHVAVSPDDGLPPSSEANIQRNRDLKAKYEGVLREREAIKKGGIYTFRDLISRYPELF
jgi:hypothetical protein